MNATELTVQTPDGSTIEHIWEAQLADYQTLLWLAQEEVQALDTDRYEYLHHTQRQRQRTTQRIIQREADIRLQHGALVPPTPDVVAAIATTIEAVLELDHTNQQRLDTARLMVANALQKLKEGRNILHQYKPQRDSTPLFLNRQI